MTHGLQAVVVGKDPDQTAGLVTDWLYDVIADTEASSGIFRIALSGGASAKFLFDLWATTEKERFRWDSWEVYFVDERAVPETDPESNFHLAKTSFLTDVAIPDSRIFPMPGTVRPLDVAAAQYADLLRALPMEDGRPVFDCVLLGIGPDGHTASLFPGTDVLDETERFVVPNTAPVEPRERISLSFPVINQARNVAFYVVGKDKGEALAATARGTTPASRVKPAYAEAVWFLDEAAYGAMEDELRTANG